MTDPPGNTMPTTGPTTSPTGSPTGGSGSSSGATAPTSSTSTSTTSSTTDGMTSSTTDGTTSSTTDGTTGPATVCGDGKMDVGEACDDGNTVDTDACTNACLMAKCGDGIVHIGVEECDDDKDDRCLNCFLDRRVFATSVEYCGNMNPKDKSICIVSDSGLETMGKMGVARGDARCNELAKSATPPLEMGKKMKAWLSTNGEDQPAARFKAATSGFEGRYVMFEKDGDAFKKVVVAYGWIGLISVNDMSMATLEKGINIDEMGAATPGTVWTNVKADGTVASDQHCTEWGAPGTMIKGAYGLTEVKNTQWTVVGDPVGVESCSNAKRLYCFEDPAP